MALRLACALAWFSPTGFQEVIGAGVEMLSLEAAIRWYATMHPRISDVWRAEWFPIAMGLATVLCDCSVVGV